MHPSPFPSFLSHHLQMGDCLQEMRFTATCNQLQVYVFVTVGHLAALLFACTRRASQNDAETVLHRPFIPSPCHWYWSADKFTVTRQRAATFVQAQRAGTTCGHKETSVVHTTSLRYAVLVDRPCSPTCMQSQPEKRNSTHEEEKRREINSK